MSSDFIFIFNNAVPVISKGIPIQMQHQFLGRSFISILAIFFSWIGDNFLVTQTVTVACGGCK